MSYGTSAGSDRYREMEILAMSPARRVVLLYTHLQVVLRKARLHLDRGEIEARVDRLAQAQEIVYELLASLDREAGGELAARLAEIYAWLFGELGRINQKPDVAALEQVLKVVTELAEAWEGAAQQTAGGPVAAG